MRFISTRFHGIIDYLLGIVLIAAPWLFNFPKNGPITYIPIILGIVTIIYSLYTDYELGVVKNISMRTHLWLDALAGIFLVLSPWLFDFDMIVYKPHLWLGIFEVVFAMFTVVGPFYRQGGYGGNIKVTREERATKPKEPVSFD